MVKRTKSTGSTEPKFSMRLKKAPVLKAQKNNKQKLKLVADPKKNKQAPKGSASNLKDKITNANASKLNDTNSKKKQHSAEVKARALKRKRQEDDSRKVQTTQKKAPLVKADNRKETQKQRQRKRFNKKGIEEQIREELNRQMKEEREQLEKKGKVEEDTEDEEKDQAVKSAKSKPSIEFCPERDLSMAHVLPCISGIFHLTEEQLKSKNELFDGEHQPVFLQVTCVRVPKTPRRQIRFVLPHSIVSPDDDVALIVPDIQRGRRRDPQIAIDHYEELLSKLNCTGLVKTVIPLNQIRTEYDQFELKRRLANTYDHFLVDARISGHVAHLLGKQFYKRRKLPVPIRTNWSNPTFDLRAEILRAQRKSGLLVHSFGDTHVCQIGHTGMKEESVAENLIAACAEIDKRYPGGWENVRAVRVKTDRSASVPIYVTLKNKNSVAVPVVQPRRPKAYRIVGGELTTVERRAHVYVKPEGKVSVKLEKDPEHKPKKTHATDAAETTE